MSKLAVLANAPESWIVGLAPQVNRRFVKEHFYSDLVDYFPDLWTVCRLMVPGLDAEEATYWKRGCYGVYDYIKAADSSYAPDRLHTLYGELPHRVYAFELVNEPIWTNLAELQCLVDFEYAVGSRYNWEGRRVLLGSFATGWPDITNPTELKVLAPLLELACHPGNGLAIHEYGRPRLKDDPSWGALWHRRFIAALKANGLPVAPLWITEIGADPWKRHYRNLEEYVADLVWLDSELAQDDEVQAGFIFTSGDPQNWPQFELPADGLRQLAAALNREG